MTNLKTIISIIRVKQWYKNFIIFLGLIFGLGLISLDHIFITVLGFISLCLISSAGYIRNDLSDINNDKNHPEKKNRPFPAGLISIKQGYVFFSSFLITGLILGFFLDFYFGLVVLALYINTELYSKFFKNIIFLDVFSIGINFILRAISGILLIGTKISPWIVLGVFFVALLLGFMKRKSELLLLTESAKHHRAVLGKYTLNSLNSLVNVSVILVITTYSIYTVVGPFHDGRLIITVPIIVFISMRQLHLSKINDILIQKNEFFKDKITIVAIFIYLISIIVLLYSDTSIFNIFNYD